MRPFPSDNQRGSKFLFQESGILDRSLFIKRLQERQSNPFIGFILESSLLDLVDEKGVYRRDWNMKPIPPGKVVIGGEQNL